MTIKYTGQFGNFIHGIPARDLTDDEWGALTEEQRRHAIDSGLYVEGKTTKAAKVAALEVAEPKGG